MNKVLKGLVAVAATAAMAIAGVAGASTAMAADTVNVTVPATTNLENHTYTAYQILSGTQATSGGALGDAAWGSGIKSDDFLTALKDDTTIGSYFNDVTDAKGFAEALSNTANFPADGANTRLVAKIAMKNKQGEGTALAAGNSTQLDKGYYLIVDSTADGQTVYNPAVLAITSDIEITDKTDVPTLEKKVQENKKDVTGDTAYGSKFNDVADYNIGDDVPFHLIGSVPDMSQYETYKYTFSDTLGEGFDAPTSIKVYLSDDKVLDTGDSDITGSFTITSPLTKTFTVSTNNLKAITGVTTGKYVIVSYTAKLNAKAEIGLPGNVNEAYLTYSSKPDNSGEGTPTTHNTPHDKVIVFTYGLDVTKVDSKNTETKLKDAEFKLYRGTDTKEYAKVLNGKVTGWTADINEGSVLKSGEDGKFKVEGLDDGDYTLKETKAPAGYNLPANGFSVKLTATTANDQAWGGDDPAKALTKLTVNQTDNTGDVNTGLGAITIKNTQGSSLPSTGGMGTTILYAAGAAIVLVAAFGIVFAVRRRNAR